MDIVKQFEYDTEKTLLQLCDKLKNKKILVALSGGADSVCLLTVLCALSEKLSFKVFAMHINHMIRGEEADRDEEFCRSLCKNKGVKLTVMKEDIPALAKEKGQSLELCAREYRYSAFEDFCVKNKIAYIATAHNSNDNAETVLYNIFRGSGLDGLCGIPQKRGNIIRPILKKSRADIISYLSALNAEYVVDSTNNENDYTRNYIRNVILPAAKRVNSDVIGSINRLSAAVETDRDYFEHTVNDIISDTASPVRLNKLPAALRTRAVRSLYIKHCGVAPESKHLVSICKALVSGGEKVICLPNGINAVTCNGVLNFIKADKQEYELESSVLEYGVNRLANGTVRVDVAEGGYRAAIDFPDKLLFFISLDKEQINGELYVRSRKTGDSLTVRKINRNIKKCLINQKVPASLRDRVPIICDSEGIVYVPFIGAADRVFRKRCKNACNITVAIEP